MQIICDIDSTNMQVWSDHSPHSSFHRINKLFLHYLKPLYLLH